MLLTLTLPLAIYGYLSWRQFEYFSLSYFVPYEAMRAELARPTLAKIVSLPLVEVNLTSGHILANMYTLTFGQFAKHPPARGVAEGMKDSIQMRGL